MKNVADVSLIIRSLHKRSDFALYALHFVYERIVLRSVVGVDEDNECSTCDHLPVCNARPTVQYGTVLVQGQVEFEAGGGAAVLCCVAIINAERRSHCQSTQPHSPDVMI